LAAMGWVVIGAVGSDAARPPPGPTDLAAHWRHAVDERD
jgi:hypothetical protein